jgi:organic hydroperoxide reductase OsmC/OhrA
MTTTVESSLARNERGRLRVGGIRVRIEPRVGAEDAGRIGRCLELFEDFCVVTASVRAGVDVKVEVEPVVAE